MVLWGDPGDLGGESGSPDQAKSVMLVVDGQELLSGLGGGTGSDLLDDAKPHTLELRLDPGLGGTMVLAYYVRVD